MSALIISLLILGVITIAIVLLAQGKILQSKGINGWTILIPGYGEYVFFKETADCGLMLWAMVAMLALGIAASFLASIFLVFFLVLLAIFYFAFCQNLADAYNRDSLFGIGLFLLPPVFFWILAFPSKETEPYDKRLLRLLSVAFAVGLLIISVGLSGLFYVNRNDMTAITAAYETYQLDETALAVEEETAEEEAALTDMEAEPEEDQETTVQAEEPADDELAELLEETGAGEPEEEEAENAAASGKYREVQKPEVFGRAFLKGDADAAMKAELTTAELDKTITRKARVRNYKKALETVINAKRTEFGFRFFMLEVGVWTVVYIIVGALIAIAALTLWILYGGRLSNAAHTVFWIPVLAVLAGAAAFLCAGFMMTPVSEDILKSIKT